MSHKVVNSLVVTLLVALVAMMPTTVWRSALAQAPDDSPEAVVEAFYTGYLDYIGSGEDLRNPLVDRAYRGSDLLTEALIARLDEELEADFIPADPILCAQDIPTSFTVEEARMLAEDEAEVVVRTSFEGHAITAILSLEKDQWLIDDLRCGEVRTPEGVVRSFYAWYIGYNQWDGQGDRPNALVDGAYRDSALLASTWVDELDALVEVGLQADPLLCAQDIPWYVKVDEIIIAEDGDEAEARMSSSFDRHGFAVQLVLEEDQWLIRGVNCQAK